MKGKPVLFSDFRYDNSWPNLFLFFSRFFFNFLSTYRFLFFSLTFPILLSFSIHPVAIFVPRKKKVLPDFLQSDCVFSFPPPFFFSFFFVGLFYAYEYI